MAPVLRTYRLVSGLSILSGLSLQSLVTCFFIFYFITFFFNNQRESGFLVSLTDFSTVKSALQVEVCCLTKYFSVDLVC